MKIRRSKLRMYVKTWLPSNPQQQLIYSIIHLVIALSNKNRSHQSSLSVPLAATHHGCVIENESGLKNTVVSRLGLHNSTAISWHFNAAGVISRQLNILYKYCTVWRRWQYSWRRLFVQLTCWWHSFLILCLYNQSKSTYIPDAHLLIKSCPNYGWTIRSYITYIHTNTVWGKIEYMDIIPPPWWICPLHCQFPLFLFLQ